MAASLTVTKRRRQTPDRRRSTQSLDRGCCWRRTGRVPLWRRQRQLHTTRAVRSLEPDRGRALRGASADRTYAQGMDDPCRFSDVPRAGVSGAGIVRSASRTQSTASTPIRKVRPWSHGSGQVARAASPSTAPSQSLTYRAATARRLRARGTHCGAHGCSAAGVHRDLIELNPHDDRIPRSRAVCRPPRACPCQKATTPGA